MEKIVIFGASSGAIKVARTLKSISVDFEYFIDNDKKKWNTMIEGKQVKSPKKLKDNAYSIIIASIYQEEIEKQLSDMGIDMSRIVPKEKYIIEYIEKNMDFFQMTINERKPQFNRERTYFIDLAEGMRVGGIESWSFNLARLLKKHNERFEIISKITDDNPPMDLQENVVKLDIEYETYKESVFRIMEEMLSGLPMTLIANWMTQTFYAGIILKKLFPDKVSIIAACHHDMTGYYKRNKFLENYADKFLCVSSGIKKNMIEQYNVNGDKVIYKPNPISYVSDAGRKAEDKSNPIFISFGARLVKAQKRADLLTELIDKIENRTVNYIFKIAGDGPYYDVLKKYVMEKKLNDRILLYGGLKYNEMSEFWKNSDIVVSLSDSEGMGLSILEAMSHGAVPIVTDTAGIREFVADNENGYVVDIGDIESMADKIMELESDRERLMKFKALSQSIIRNKCSEEEYYRLIIENFKKKEGEVSAEYGK